MRRRTLFAILTMAAAALAQSPKFEVVSLKHSGDINTGGRIEGDKTYMHPYRSLRYQGTKLSGDVPLFAYLQYAFPMKPWECDGPDWINNEYYDINAIAPAETTPEMARSMMQTVLAERLGFKYHYDNRPTSIYALVVEPGGLKLSPGVEKDLDPGRIQMGKFQRKSATLADFAGFLGFYLTNQVFDRTGIPGSFQFDLDWTRETIASMRDFGGRGDPAIALRGVKPLGLRLEPRKEPLKFLIIDHVNKEPTAN
jgi:uncharacterized protein (TIGR03435 family)